jgi:hypothetical protein
MRPIPDYQRRLGRELWMKPGAKRRVLKEVAQHLETLQADRSHPFANIAEIEAAFGNTVALAQQLNATVPARDISVPQGPPSIQWLGFILLVLAFSAILHDRAAETSREWPARIAAWLVLFVADAMPRTREPEVYARFILRSQLTTWCALIVLAALIFLADTWHGRPDSAAFLGSLVFGGTMTASQVGYALLRYGRGKRLLSGAGLLLGAPVLLVPVASLGDPWAADHAGPALIAAIVACVVALVLRRYRGTEQPTRISSGSAIV